MQSTLFCLTAATTIIALSAQEPMEYSDARARELFTAARIAIAGGPGGVSRLHSLMLKGRSKIPESGGGLMDASVEIRILLPDCYERIDAGTFGRRIEGYSGNTVLDRIERPNESAAQGNQSPNALLSNRFALARFILGFATWVGQEVPLRLETRQTAIEMPGAADPMGLSASSERGFAVRLILDPKSKLPARLTYWDGERRVRTMTFSEHQSVGGYKFPYHVVTTSGERVVDDLAFADIVVNPPLKKTDFTR
jgi:hypothetical protein